MGVASGAISLPAAYARACTRASARASSPRSVTIRSITGDARMAAMILLSLAVRAVLEVDLADELEQPRHQDLPCNCPSPATADGWFVSVRLVDSMTVCAAKRTSMMSIREGRFRLITVVKLRYGSRRSRPGAAIRLGPSGLSNGMGQVRFSGSPAPA